MKSEGNDRVLTETALCVAPNSDQECGILTEMTLHIASISDHALSDFHRRTCNTPISGIPPKINELLEPEDDTDDIDNVDNISESIGDDLMEKLLADTCDEIMDVVMDLTNLVSTGVEWEEVADQIRVVLVERFSDVRRVMKKSEEI